MRLLVASTLLPPISGGAEHVAWELAQRLAETYDVHLLTTGNQKCTTRTGRLTVHFVNRLPLLTLLYSTVANPAVKAIVGSMQPDIIHSHMVLPWGYIFRNEKAKKVITCHGSDVFPRKRYPRRFLLDRALQNADIVTAPSKWLTDYVEEEYDVSCTTLPNGIDTQVFAPMKGISTRKNVILYVGRFVARKGIKELVEAARTLQEYEFWLVGNPKTSTVEVPCLPNMKVIGFVDNLALCYNQASLCVFPSHWENFPLVGLEAMACGRTIVATRLGFSEYVEDGRDGVLVEPGRSDELIQSIKYLMEDETIRTRLERNAREKAMLYDWRIIVNRYRTIYNGL
jgi:glycosyltransferase involved in cell wall biosynthesis